MQLHKGDLYWDETKKDTTYLTLEKDVCTDTLIIGGGMTGAILSHVLGKSGREVMVVDKAIPGYGSSWGNTGMIQYNSDMLLHDMAKKHREKKAVDFYQLSIDAMNELDSIVAELPDDIGYSRTHSLYLAKEKDDLASMKNNYAMLTNHSFPCEWLTEETLKNVYNIHAYGAIRTGNDAGLNPFKMVQAIHKSNLNKGIPIYHECNVEKIVEGDQFCVYTANGHKITCENLIIATGYAKDMYKPIEEMAKRNTTYSFVTKPLQVPLWGNKEMIWDSATDYLYFRVNEENRLIAGGRDERGADLSSHKEIKETCEQLLQSVKNYYPDLEAEIDHTWQSVFGVSKDGLPFIGQDPVNPNKYFALGFGGNGTCYSVAAAMIINDFLQNRTHPYAYTTAFPRI
jgi:glycine/D-amino acid oxidase-like deaminating enzyme